MKAIKKYSQCFVCGDQNPYGLKVDFFWENNVAKGEYIAQNHFQGYKDILHGGILSSLLDEVMIKAILAQDLLAVTAEINVKFKKPVKIGEKLTLEGKVVGAKGKFLFTQGKVTNKAGELVAEALGKFFKIERVNGLPGQGLNGLSG